MARGRYSAKQKAEAVGIAVVQGQREASRQTGIPVMTINGWYNAPQFVQLRTTKKAEFEEALWVGVQAGLKAVVDALEGEPDLGKRATAFGILYDKHALMTGQATARTESRTLTEGMDDHERAALRRILDEALEAAEIGPTGDPV